MFEIVKAYSMRHGLLPERGRIVVAVSGGADSLCLLHILHQLCGPGKQYPEVQLHVAHFNHQLRGEESERDAAAVAELAHLWKLPITGGSANVAALARQEQRSLEEAARLARYQFLREVAQGQLIAVGHHQDDQVETLLLHWLRGGGLASMIGLQPLQQDLIRPLLCLTHAEILDYCQQQNLIPLEDTSNSDLRFLRNRIRHEILPLLTELNPGIRETILRNAEIMQVDFAWIEEQIDAHWPKIVIQEDNHLDLKIGQLRELPLSLQRHLLRRATAQLCGGQSPLELRHYRLIEELIKKSSHHEILTLHLPNRLRAKRTGEILAFYLAHEDDAQITERWDQDMLLPIPGQIAVPGTPWIAKAAFLPEDLMQQVRPALQRSDWTTVWHLFQTTAHSVYVDADKLLNNQSHLLHIRTRRDGDRIRPLGMAQEKKVQDILVDKHIPRAQRDQIPLFFNDTHCVWLAGICLDDRLRLTEHTDHIVQLSLGQPSPLTSAEVAL